MFHMDAWEWKYLVKVQYQPVGRHNTSKRKKAYYEKSYLWILTVTPPSVTPEPVKIAQTIENCFGNTYNRHRGRLLSDTIELV